MKEQKKLAAHYLVTFYNDVMALRRYYGLYIMELNKLKAKYKKFLEKESALDNISLEESDKKILDTYIDNIKFHLNILVPQYRNINKNILKNENFEEFDKLYGDISSQLVIVQEDLTKLMQVLEEFLLNSIIDDLLTTAQDVYNAVYGTEQPKEQN